eukprot:TRINITY_DN1134_c0_g1_i2.p1 TRINITY_DN1134_c0_g1~~TRINITY_DN1134_c0_g1_i2.p1  ORF type:complete len:432 (-),score=39.64 TRINITY_DN1134_c0_g1_i2:73-1368(-)
MSAYRPYCFILWLAPTMSIIGATPISPCGENNTAGTCDSHVAAVGGAKMLQNKVAASSSRRISFVKATDAAELTDEKKQVVSAYWSDSDLYSASAGGFRFTRRVIAGQSCEDQDEPHGQLDSIYSKEECEAAFTAFHDHAKETGDKEAEKVEVVSSASKPKGCFSDCFDPSAGFSCLRFNVHQVGSGQPSNGQNRFLMCAIRTAPQTTEPQNPVEPPTRAPRPDEMTTVLTTTITAPFQTNFVRRINAGEKCDGQLRNIDTLAKCERAFVDLRYASREMEDIKPVNSPIEPTGCYSKCFSEHTGHYCRRFNSHSNPTAIQGLWKHVLCKNDNVSSSGDALFVRLAEGHASCESQHLSSITNFDECAEAFENLRYEKGAEKVLVVRHRGEPAGCFSSCFDELYGYSCRKFNKHEIGSGDTSDGVSRFLLCER